MQRSNTCMTPPFQALEITRCAYGRSSVLENNIKTDTSSQRTSGQEARGGGGDGVEFSAQRGGQVAQLIEMGRASAPV